jgi:hypothetical protein
MDRWTHRFDVLLVCGDRHHFGCARNVSKPVADRRQGLLRPVATLGYGR